MVNPYDIIVLEVKGKGHNNMKKIKKGLTLLITLITVALLIGSIILLFIAGIWLICFGSFPTLATVAGVYLIAIGFTVLLALCTRDELKQALEQNEQQKER